MSDQNRVVPVSTDKLLDKYMLRSMRYERVLNEIAFNNSLNDVASIVELAKKALLAVDD